MNEPVSKILLEEIRAVENADEDDLLSKDIDIFGHVKVKVMVRVGHIETDIGALMSAKKGDVLKLEQLVDEPVTLLVDHKAVARANLVTVGDNFGVEIVEIAK